MATASAAPSIVFDGTQFRVAGWPAPVEPSQGWSSVFKVYAGPPDQVPQMLGAYEFRNNELTFHPRFPPAKGIRYTAIFSNPGIASIQAVFDGPPKPTNAVTRVDRIYPSTAVLPSNALRLYLYFSAPMSRGEAYQHIRLIDLTTNRPVDIPFLELQQELWDANNQRLTLLFDPGRIKRGLVPTETIGPAIVEGKQYKLVIDPEWHDARGVGLVESAEKVFRCGPSDRIPPSPKSWRVIAPKSGTTEPLIVTFPKSMDYVLMQRMLGVFDNAGMELTGSIAVSDNETQWRFTPTQPWKPGVHRLTADNTLEDISGNHLDRPFDVDIFETVTKRIDSKTTSVDFAVQ